MTELDLLLKDCTEEQRERIHKQADRLEVYFNTDGDVCMKDKDEGWDGMLPKGDAVIINETTNNKGNK